MFCAGVANITGKVEHAKLTFLEDTFTHTNVSEGIFKSNNIITSIRVITIHMSE